MHQKVYDARINVVDPLAPGSSRKQYSKSISLCTNARQTKLSPGSWRNNKNVGRIVTCFMYLRHSNIVLT